MRSDFEIIELELEEFVRQVPAGEAIEIFTDGSCRGNPGPGGWGCVFVWKNRRATLSGAEYETTNNRMELRAAIEGVRAMPVETDLRIFTDSSYLKNGITTWVKTWKQNNWQTANKQVVKNRDLWIELDAVVEGRKIMWNWVKAHAECLNNNNADFLAKSAIVTLFMQGDEAAP